MSLKEWKNNELNTLLMKKWGLLNEVKNPGKYRTGMEKGYDDDGDGVPNGADKDPKDGSVQEDLDEAHCARKEDEDLEEAQSRRSRERESVNQRDDREGMIDRAKKGEGLEEADDPDLRTMTQQRAAHTKTRQSAADLKYDQLLQAVRDFLAQSGTQATGDLKSILDRLGSVMTKKAEVNESVARTDKITAAEARKITRRIIERVKKESN